MTPIHVIELVPGGFARAVGAALQADVPNIFTGLFTAHLDGPATALAPGDVEITVGLAQQIRTRLHNPTPADGAAPSHLKALTYEVMITAADLERSAAAYPETDDPEHQLRRTQWLHAADQAAAELREHPDVAAFAILALTEPCQGAHP